MEELARQYRATKFCAIRSDAAIENYPDRNVPTILVYGEGDLRSQLVTLATLNGQKTTVRDLEKYLENLGAIRIPEERRQYMEDDKLDGAGRKTKIIY